VNTLGRRVRERRLTRDNARRLYREASRLHASSNRAELTPPIHLRAERLTLSLTTPLRAPDALHLATASTSKRHLSSPSIRVCAMLPVRKDCSWLSRRSNSFSRCSNR
jgi:hypothetical protein